MAGFMKNAMSYLGMSDVAEGEDDFEDDVDTGETSFDSDRFRHPDAFLFGFRFHAVRSA